MYLCQYYNQSTPSLLGFRITCAGFAKSLRLENACIFLPKGFSERSERRKPGDGRCRERSERQRTALGGTRRTMAKRASVASDFGHRLQFGEVRDEARI